MGRISDEDDVAFDPGREWEVHAELPFEDGVVWHCTTVLWVSTTRHFLVRSHQPPGFGSAFYPSIPLTEV